MTTKITFQSEQAHSAFHSMAEGMMENALDDSRGGDALAMEAAIKATSYHNDQTYPVTFNLDDSTRGAARKIIENGRDSEDSDFDQIVMLDTTLAGDRQMSMSEALGIVADIASRWGENQEEGFNRVQADATDDECKQIAAENEFEADEVLEVRNLWRAIDVVKMLLEQRGCEGWQWMDAIEQHNPHNRSGKLTDMCDVIVFG